MLPTSVTKATSVLLPEVLAAEAASEVASVVVLVAVLGWFFVLSPYGAPASPVYAEF